MREIHIRDTEYEGQGDSTREVSLEADEELFVRATLHRGLWRTRVKVVSGSVRVLAAGWDNASVRAGSVVALAGSFGLRGLDQSTLILDLVSF